MSSDPIRVFIGFDPREAAAFSVLAYSIHARASQPVAIAPLMLSQLKRELRRARHPLQSTDFSFSRFLVPSLAGFRGWALFMDCDMLVRHRLDTLFEMCEAGPDKAVFCVQHHHVPKTDTKMDDQMQLVYARKNWTSVMAINLDHKANQDLTVGLINSVPGRDLHRFCWLEKHGDMQVIGALPQRWNWLVGYTEPDPDPAIVHYTEGGPWLAAEHPEFRNLPFEAEYLQVLRGV
jgi:lipopolysaccharide biosynthesis glycosyltransferase